MLSLYDTRWVLQMLFAGPPFRYFMRCIYFHVLSIKTGAISTVNGGLTG
jgi:hypothetical protein